MRRYAVYFALFVLMLINYIDRVNLSVAAKFIASYFDLSPVQMGYLFSSYLWTYVLLLVPFGFAVDRWGARSTTVVAIMVWSLAGILTGAATAFTVLLVSRLCLGMGEAGTFPVGGRVIREWAPKGERGTATAILNAGAYAGPAFGSILVGWLISEFGWRESFFITGAMGIVFGFAWWALYRKPEKAAWLSLSERTFILNDREDRKQPSSAGTSAKSEVKLGRLLRNRTLWALALVEGCAAFTLYLFLSWVPSYLEVATGLNVLKIGLFSAVPYATAAVLVLVLSWLSDRALARISRREILAICMLCAGSIVAAPLFSSVWVILALVSFSLAGVATAISLNVTLANDLLEDGSYAGLSVACTILGGNVFGIFAPIFTGYIVAAVGGVAGYTAAFSLAGALLVIGALVALIGTRRPITTTPLVSVTGTQMANV